MIRFSSKKRDEFVHAAEHRQAVKLVNTQKSISKCLFKWTERCCAAVISKLAGGRRADASVQAEAHCREAQGAEGVKPDFINGVQVGCDVLNPHTLSIGPSSTFSRTSWIPGFLPIHPCPHAYPASG